MKKLAIALLLYCALSPVWAAGTNAPVRLIVIGLEHDAVGDFISRARDHREVQLVGIVESNQALVTSYARLLNLSTNFFYPSLESLLAKTNAQAAAVFTRTYDHPSVVEACAAHNLNVMLEKPLAVNLEGALVIASAAKKSGIQIMVDYETSWYSSFDTAYTMVHNQHAIGDWRKMVVTAGDQGPKDAGISDVFLNWLTDPVLNGGGALTDFGCYGADLITWFADGQRPDSVLAESQNINPEAYTKVEDEAVIILTYPRSQGIVQASWNLPFPERSLQIYGRTGYVLAPRMDLLRLRLAGTEESELELQTQPEPGLFSDDISYFAAIARGEVKPAGPSCLQVNMITTEILDAARKSVELKKQITLPPTPAW